MAVAPRATCPLCFSVDRIEKVSNIVRNGRGKLVWEDGEVSHYETELSELLDEPAPPKAMPFYRLLLSAAPPLLILIAILGIVTILETQTFFHVPDQSISVARNIALGWFGVVIPVVLVAQFVHSRLNYRRELPRWAHARRRWTGLYYCSRDDVVFLPDENVAVAPTEMHTLINPPEPAAEAPAETLPFRGLREVTNAK